MLTTMAPVDVRILDIAVSVLHEDISIVSAIEWEFT